ncbi:RsmB/NOP family class I SAM-dependent RNA methyltransferase [Opitutus terrae]|uniref:Fmu (Sun) domain protein n=1 Tax=Opitutus terrae (strain DSM 11246 / JCM 15787 / PB90-1) TaxID=452637 RepID=B1ZZX2_OPITP|nr:RsmB/NOP family class I SAM-dependent RNA methyltransferase [Opitutus terrae]ACB77305.1 Fmu (Sun) domain protein [Opitutus terrae PB90-1]
MSAPVEARTTAWPAAARLLARWLDRRERVDELLESLGGSLTGTERARCQHLVFGAIRHFGRIDAAIGRLVSHSPRFATRAVLLVAGFELIEARAERGGAPTRASEAGTTNAPDQPTPVVDGRVAKIVHHAVEQTKQLASPAEARMVNAVVRKLAGVLAEPPPPKLAPADVLAEYFSHPVWLVRSWLAQFGAAATRALLEWNQQPAPVYARWRSSFAEPAEDKLSVAAPTEGNPVPVEAAKAAPKAEEPVPAWFKPTAWAGFFEIPPGHWTEIEPLLQRGRIYLQDPATRIPVELLAPAAGELVLDGCAAPGGKSLLIADSMRQGRLVAMDLPGARIGRLKENLARVPAGVEVALVQGDLRQDPAGLLREHKLPAQFPAVLLDVPCSNTGVMRHRVDVKWRLQEGDFRKHPLQQLALLRAAARLVAPGGRLVYSTCSIDTEENEHVVQEFLAGARPGEWKLENHQISRPWEAGHDGGAAFLLRKNTAPS